MPYFFSLVILFIYPLFLISQVLPGISGLCYIRTQHCSLFLFILSIHFLTAHILRCLYSFIHTFIIYCLVYSSTHLVFGLYAPPHYQKDFRSPTKKIGFSWPTMKTWTVNNKIERKKGQGKDTKAQWAGHYVTQGLSFWL